MSRYEFAPISFGSNPESQSGCEEEFWHKAERELLAMEDLREIANEPPPVLPG
jgi:hypothetical protein